MLIVPCLLHCFDHHLVCAGRSTEPNVGSLDSIPNLGSDFLTRACIHFIKMLSNLTQSIRRKFQAEAQSPGVSARRIVFPEAEPARSSSRKRSFFYYRDNNRRDPPRDADHDDNDDEDDDAEEEDDESESSSRPSEEAPLLPIFSSDHLNTLPVFSMTHAFREMVIERCDTVLSWEQLRSPQVSQFLIKPIQQEIKDNHLNSATQYALLANALQFNKEASVAPGNSGTERTRAMICELIAIKLLRECNTRDLIDALSYDFDPLQGQLPNQAQAVNLQRRQIGGSSARISCIEVALRANAKRFLAHPLVVQHLEAIWNGSIVFHSVADSMHRKRSMALQKSYGTHSRISISSNPSLANNRTASLYNPRDASLFKLSRLRVPRYRNILSTISFAILLILFIAVLEDKSLDITTLEIIFWIWTAGYMLDEVIGFNEQGFSLYIASFWNTFDLGILVLFFLHLCLRLYGIVLPDDHDYKHYVAKLSYDILATSSVLLFPRLFSVLDHYRYFSQLIIAFRMMAQDMMAIFLLIIIFCSGFLVALTFAFSKGPQTDTPGDVAYALLQMLLGFTPAAWDRWGDYNGLGKTVLVIFLFVCHFVVVTILITVMTNSFMDIVRNANEEHQYLFAINVISNVKSDSLFAYVPPLNVLQWIFTPLKFVLPFREYLKVNRTVIKLTHLPILWTIYLYERLILRPRYVDAIDLVEKRGPKRRTFSERLPRLAREPSIATFRQDAALEEVFKQATMRTAGNQDRRKSTNVVSSWMNTMDDEEPPQEQDRNVVDKLERRRLGSGRLPSTNVHGLSATRRPTSIASDPNDLISYADFLSPRGRASIPPELTPSAIELPPQHTDADGDDEMMTNEHDEEIETNLAASDIHPYRRPETGASRKDYFKARMAPQVQIFDPHDSTDSALPDPNAAQLSRSSGRSSYRPPHMRNVSSATMIYNPPIVSGSDTPMRSNVRISSSKGGSPKDTGGASPSLLSKPAVSQPNRKSPKRMQQAQGLRPALPTKNNAAFRSVPDMTAILSHSRPQNIQSGSSGKPRRSSLEMDLVSDIGDNKAIGGGYVGAIPASFASKMAYANNALRQSQIQLRQEEEKRRQESSETVSRLIMTRLNTLEEGFREVVHEVREGMRQVGSGVASRQRSPEREGSALQVQKRPPKRFKERHERGALGSGAASVISTEREAEKPKTAGSNGTTSRGADGKHNYVSDKTSSPAQITFESSPGHARDARREESSHKTHPADGNSFGDGPQAENEDARADRETEPSHNNQE